MRKVEVLALVVLLAAGTASASSISTLPGNTTWAAFGQPDSTLCAQGIVADNVFLSDASLVLSYYSYSGNADLKFNILVTGARNDYGLYAPDMTNILFNSGPELLLQGTGMTTFTEHPQISVTNGERLFLVLDAFSYPVPGSQALAYITVTSGNPYAAGEIVFMNTASNGISSLAEANIFPWNHWYGDLDMAFSANFQPVPEPATVSLFCMGIAGILLRRSRKQV